MLPADVSRCGGRMHTAGLGQRGCVAVSITHGHAECVRCRRREPAPEGHQWVAYMSPPEFVDGKCPRRIEPQIPPAP